MTQNITITNQVEYYTHTLSQSLQFDYERFVIKLHKDAIDRGEAVEYHTERLKEIKESNTFSNSKVFAVISDNDYYRIESHDGEKSVIAFVDKITGGVYKPESWDRPESDPKYNLLDETSREDCFLNVDWLGEFLNK